MMRNSFLVVFCLVLSNVLIGQIPSRVVVSKSEGGMRFQQMSCNDQFAGTKSYGAGVGQSRDITAANLATNPRIIVLCWGDSLEIRHGGDQNLSGDPRPSSPAGVAYAVYRTQPTVTGPNLSSVLTDNFLNDGSGNLLVVTGNRLDGNVDFFNRGFFQNNFNGGAPIQLWFAPITFDSLTNSGQAGYEPDPVTGEIGPCVHVNVDEAFSVIYLNRIEIVENRNYKCRSEITITGGMPEFTGLERYNLDIFSEDVPGVIGSPCENFTSPAHNRPFLMRFDEQGRYRLIVSDSWGCDAVDLFVDIDCTPTEVVFGQDMTVDTNELFCMDITVNDFEQIGGFSFQMIFDTTLFEFVEFRNLTWQSPQILFTAQLNNFVSANLFDAAFNTHTLNDGERIFTVCFRSKGRTGCGYFEENPDVAVSNEFNDLDCLLPGFFTSSEVCVETFMQGEIDFASCSTLPGTSDGSILFSPRSGTAPFDFRIFDINDLNTVLGSGSIVGLNDTLEYVGLPPGVYQLELTDASGNTEIVQVTIAAAPRISIGALSITNPVCYDQSNGSVTLQSINDGVSPYEIVWSTGQRDVNTIAGLANGEYSVVVYDDYGCPAEATTSLFTDTLRVQMVAEQLTSCPGTSDGRIWAQAFGGTAPYDFYWNGGSPVLDVFANTITDAPSGLQHLRVVDANGCELIVDTFFLDSYNMLDVDSILVDISCFGRADGVIELLPQSGLAPFQYEWSDIGQGPSRRENLAAGVYGIRVTDATGCFDSLSFRLTEPDSLSLYVDSMFSTSLLCHGAADGRIVLLAEGGDFLDGFTLDWTPNVSDAFSAINLAPGDYDVLLTDSRGCQDRTSFRIVESEPIRFSIPPVVEPNCPGDTTGLTVDFVVGGAGGPYLFNVNAGTDYPIGTVVPVYAGTQVVEVMDTLGCAQDTMIRIEEPPNIEILLPELVEVNLGDSSQRLVPDIRPLASRADVVRYQWTPPLGLACDTCAVTGVTPPNSTTYTLQITDNKGCQYENSVFVQVRKVRNVFVPEAFTPNGDAHNPLMAIYTGQGVRRINYFRIFNRWGDQVFERRNIDPGVLSEQSGWDGMYRGREQPVGVYVYVAEVEFIDGERIVYRGDFVLLR